MIRKFLFSAFLCHIVLFFFIYNGRAQQIPVRDEISEYLHVLRIADRIPSKTGGKGHFHYIENLASLADHPWSDIPPSLVSPYQNGSLLIAPHDLELQNYWQSLEPGGSNDGAVWQSRGFTSVFSGGLFARYGIVSFSMRPSVLFTQNRNYELSPYPSGNGRSEFAYPLGNIDWPQRFGTGSFWTFDAGESYVRADYKGWATGLSNETMWWSPARHYALLLSNNAPGFPHFFIGIPEPKKVGIGYLETKLFWGKLMESDYFDDNPENNERYITGGRISFTPKLLPGLTVGINRIFYQTIPPEGIPAGDLFKIFEAFTKINFTSSSNLGGNDQADQMLSFFGSWIFPNSGLEIYGEWARTDHSWNWRDFLTEPEHSRGYTLGLQKIFELRKQRLLSVHVELTQLEASKTGLFRGYPTFYVHGRTVQGYTHRGQLLGASIGPGSSSQYIGSSLFFGKGKIKLWAERVTINNDFLYTFPDIIASMNQTTDNWYRFHNIEMRFGASLIYYYKQFETRFGLTVRRELNDDYLYRQDRTHLGIELSLRYRLSEFR